MKAITTLFTLILVFALSANCQDITRDKTTNVLKIVTEGGDQGFVDETYIHFREGATTAYDVPYDSKKWYSMDPEATMIWTIASDNTNLAINKLPLEDLHAILNSIPLQFVCGYGGGEYILTFSELDTFDEKVEIWLQDLLIGNDWINVTAEESVYTFNGLPEEPADRFFIHILDPAAVTDVDGISTVKKPVKIYASKNNIYIINPAGSVINDIKIYNILGSEVNHKITSASGTLNTIQINGQTGYYFARVLTDNHVYTEKVLIIY